MKEILTGSYPIPVSKGGTGVTSISSLKDSLGINSSSGVNIETWTDYKYSSSAGSDGYIPVSHTFSNTPKIIIGGISGANIMYGILFYCGGTLLHARVQRATDSGINIVNAVVSEKTISFRYDPYSSEYLISLASFY